MAPCWSEVTGLSLLNTAEWIKLSTSVPNETLLERQTTIKDYEGGAALVWELILSDVLPWSGSILFYLPGKHATHEADKWVQFTFSRTTSLTPYSFTVIDFPPMWTLNPDLACDLFRHLCSCLCIHRFWRTLLGCDTCQEILLPILRHNALFTHPTVDKNKKSLLLVWASTQWCEISWRQK